MSNRDEMLSQEEINALLSTNEEEEITAQSPSSKPPVANSLSPLEQDTLGEVGNIAFNNAATTLSTLLSEMVEITTPKVSVMGQEALKRHFKSEQVAIRVNYTEGFSGINLFVIKSDVAAIIADLMLGGSGEAPEEDLGEIHLSALQEAMNQMMGTAATSISTMVNRKINISTPSIDKIDVERGQGLDVLEEEETFAAVSFKLKIGSLIDSTIIQLLPIHFAKEYIQTLLANNEQDHKSSSDQTMYEEEKRGTNMSETKYSEQHIGEQVSQSSSVQTASFPDFQDVSSKQQNTRNLDMLLDIPLNVSVELGRSQKTVKDILELSSGSIVELDKLAGEPVDIHVNNKLIAKGEVVVIEENFGVRVTDIISRSERIQKLK
ncbi:flagellar motor switch phosphatase FliY [Salirhabdus salicampi]|uniref:flagellar motor switch phosphatase FliY n=1 Tax=Salirhabdus salicampi TaxID=476102 RepID=UPI0020C4E158|nr:flagellar motor switch phosphatase FliY [Salirhabdus salicampi]MCP8616512.1 flagellar motor switch phosphatase FliY [Salirhabdus salicampi]